MANLKRTGKFAIIGIILALFNFAIYTFLARVVFNSNELLWLDSIISYLLATILAYILHSKITWKERTPTKAGVIMFFVWNFITALAISPFFTLLFGLITPLYEFAHNISSAIGLPFDYNFVESTGIFCFTTLVTMVFNYIFYDKLVFGEIKFKKPTKSQIIATILYSLPVIFFIISYFLITASGEDIFQGAGNHRTGIALNPIGDAINAFNYNSRITDMYAWSVIDYYDYQFQFGPDTFFRLIDVLMSCGVFYAATYIILKRKPKLAIKDSLIFCAIFASIIITPFGRPFYIEFSMIHNYVPLALATLLIAIPYFNLFTKKSTPKRPYLFAFAMLILGIYFGMAATITPLAFLATIIILCVIKRKHLPKLPLWFYSGILGTIIGFLICWLAGSGINHYTNPTTSSMFDYVSLGDLFSNPSATIPRILFHELYNFGLFLLPIVAIIIIGIIFSKKPKQYFTKNFWKTLPKETKNILLACSLFTIIHILGASLIKAPPRLTMPAYLIGAVLLFRFFLSYFKNSKLLSFGIILVTIFITFSHTLFLAIYHNNTSNYLDQIKTTSDSNFCLDLNVNKPPRIQILDLSQANIIVDWGMPQPFYGKEYPICPHD